MFEAIGLITEVMLEEELIDVKQRKPVPVSKIEDLKSTVDAFPCYFKKYSIKNNIIVNPSKDSIIIGESDTEKIAICEKYKNEGALLLYMNKEYRELVEGIRFSHLKKFVHNHIDFQKIIRLVVDMVAGLSNAVDMKTSISNCLRMLKREVEDFNKDLQQISEELSYRFVTDLNDLCLHLLWKWHEEHRWREREEVFNQVERQRNNQHKIFMGYLDTDVRLNSQSNALIFVQKYSEYLLHENEQKKRAYIDAHRTEFLKKYSRARVQELVDSRMAMCNEEEAAFEYLVHPENALNRLYAELVAVDSKELVDNYVSHTITCYKELQTKIAKIKEYIQEDHENWFSDQLFSDCRQAPERTVKDIFLELFAFGETINSDTLSPNFQLKPGNIEFKLPSRLIDQVNIKFFKANQLQNMEIVNYSLFISSLEEKLREMLTEIEQKTALLDTEKSQYCEQVKLVLCPSKCYCCKRLCDVDMRLDEHHKIHQCNFGHQLRAVSGVRVEKRNNGVTEHYASVKRCEDIEDTSSFQFNSKELTWREFCEQKKHEWTFKKSELVTEKQRLIFVNLWKLAGKRICKERIKEDGLDMIYLDYDQTSVQLIEEKNQSETQFVIAIDGSGSMHGRSWEELLDSLRNILVNLSTSSSYHVSIIVFASSATIFCENQAASTVNVKAIPYPGGGTSASAAWPSAASGRGGTSPRPRTSCRCPRRRPPGGRDRKR